MEVNIDSDNSCSSFSPRSIDELISYQAQRYPEAIALAYEDSSITYAELERKADCFSRHLRSLGAGPNQRIPLLIDRSLNMIVGLYAVLKTRSAYIPIDSNFPDSRVADIIEDSGAELFITQAQFADRIPEDKTIVLVDDESSWADRSYTVTEEEANSRDLAYVIYTSGSTRKPKGVCIEHRNLISYIQAHHARLEGNRPTSHALVSTIAADLGVTSIFGALTTGGTLHILSHDCATNPELFSDYLSTNQIDVLKIVPSHLLALQDNRPAKKILPAKHLILGGEPLSTDWAYELLECCTECKIHNEYGPTETTVGVSDYIVGSSTPSCLDPAI